VKRRKPSRRAPRSLVARADASLLDVIDHVLTKGVVVHGEVLLGVAGVDLVYLQLSALLCATDRLEPRRRGRAR
jgi:hypothetical protein